MISAFMFSWSGNDYLSVLSENLEGIVRMKVMVEARAKSGGLVQALIEVLVLARPGEASSDNAYRFFYVGGSGSTA